MKGALPTSEVLQKGVLMFELKNVRIPVQNKKKLTRHLKFEIDFLGIWKKKKGFIFHLQVYQGNQKQIWAAALQKPTKWSVRPAKTHISLGICPVWSDSSLSTWRRIGTLATHWVYSQDFDQSGQMPRLILSLRWAHMSFCLFCHAELICHLIRAYHPIKGTLARSVGPDLIPQNAASYQGLYY